MSDVFSAVINPRKLYIRPDDYTVSYHLWKDPNFSAPVKDLNVTLSVDKAFSADYTFSNGVYTVYSDGDEKEYVELEGRVYYYNVNNTAALY